MGNDPVDPFSDPTVERDQSFWNGSRILKCSTFGAGVLVSHQHHRRQSVQQPVYPRRLRIGSTVRRWRGIPRIILISHYLPLTI